MKFNLLEYETFYLTYRYLLYHNMKPCILEMSQNCLLHNFKWIKKADNVNISFPQLHYFRHNQISPNLGFVDLLFTLFWFTV